MDAPLDVRTRLTELAALRDGWLDGRGAAPPPAGLDWLAAALARHYPAELPPPHLYPTAEGGVRAEWSLRPLELSLDVDLAARSGFWHVLNLDNDAEETRTLDLGSAAGWDGLAAAVRAACAAGVAA